MTQRAIETNATRTSEFFDNEHQRVARDEEEGVGLVKEIWDARKALMMSRLASARGTIGNTDDLVYSVGSLLYDSKLHLKSMPRVDAQLVRNLRDTDLRNPLHFDFMDGLVYQILSVTVRPK